MTTRVRLARRRLFVLATLVVLAWPLPASAGPAPGNETVAAQDRPAVAPKKAHLRAPTSEELKKFKLRLGRDECAGLFEPAEAPLDGPKLCTHGPDIAELDATDGSAAEMTAQAVASAAILPPGIPCYTTGPYVKVMYLYQTGTANLLGQRLPLIREAVALADWIYNKAATAASRTRHVRWKMSSCKLSVTPAAVDTSSFYTMRNGLISAGHLASSEKVLAIVESNDGCYGQGQLWSDDSPGSSNLNNRGGMFAYVAGFCLQASIWGEAVRGEVVAHELGHTLGAVADSSPHTSHASHCWDESDIMCYADGGSHALEQRCPVVSPEPFDCNRDDYFHPAPATGSYLATHWNTARNQFLATSAPSVYDKLERPTVSISSPASGSAVAGTAVIGATAGAPAGSSIQQVSFTINGQDWGHDTTFPYQLQIETLYDFAVAAAYPNGTKLTVVPTAMDNFGRTKVGAAATFTVSNPTVRLISPTYASRVSGTAFWSAIASAGLGRTISKVDLLVNGVVKGTDTTAPYNGNWSTATYADGEYLSVQARVTDSGGVQREGPIREITIDRPDVTLINPAQFGSIPFSKSTTLVADATARWGATINKVEFFVDNVEVCADDTTYPYTCTFTPGAPDTPDTFAVKARATDSTGGVTTTDSVDHQFTPHSSDTVTVTSPASGATLPRTTPTTLTASHASTVGRAATSMNFYVDGGWVGFDDTPVDGFSAPWTPADSFLATGALVTIVAEATIANGDSSYTAVSAGTPVIIGGTSPTVTISVPSTTVGKIVNVTASVVGGGDPNSSGVDFYVNGEPIGYDYDPAGGWSVSWDTKTASDGFLALRAVANTANGTATSAPRYVSLLNLYAGVTAPANGATVSGTYQLKAFASGDPEGSVEWVKWYVDGVHVGSDSTPGYALSWNSATVADGSHTVRARVFASDGRWRDSATWTFTVNN